MIFWLYTHDVLVSLAYDWTTEMMTLITQSKYSLDLQFALHLKYLEHMCFTGWMLLLYCSLPVRRWGRNEPAVSFKPALNDFLFTWRLCNKLHKFHYEVGMSNVSPFCLHNQNPQSFISFYLELFLSPSDQFRSNVHSLANSCVEISL